jgi:hypothetical protein
LYFFNFNNFNNLDSNTFSLFFKSRVVAVAAAEDVGGFPWFN